MMCKARERHVFWFHRGSDYYAPPVNTYQSDYYTRYQPNKGSGSQGLRSATAGVSGEHRRLPNVVQTQVQEDDTLQAHAATAVRGQPCLKIGREEAW